MASTRTFSTGATRNDDSTRIDPEGFFSPVVLEEFCNYMHKNRFRENGEIRASDNWQLGISQQAYAKSLWRHLLAFMKTHRQVGNHKDEANPYRNEQLISDCCALMFNAMGYLSEELKKPVQAQSGFWHPQVSTPQQREVAWGRLRSQLLQDMEPEETEPGYGSGI